MPIPWIAIGVTVGAIGTASGIFSAGANKQAAQVSGAIAAGKRRLSGTKEMANLRVGMNLSGVEANDRVAAEGSPKTEGREGKSGKIHYDMPGGISYDPGKVGFIGIGQEDGGSISNARDYSGVTDSASIILGTSEDSIELDISAIRLSAANAQFAFAVEGFGAGLETFAKLAIGAQQLYDFYSPPATTVADVDPDAYYLQD